MAVIKAVSSHAPISVAIDYVEKREKTESRLLSGIRVAPQTAKEEMESTKELYGKTGGRTYKHFVQSFAPGEEITPEEAFRVANEFAEKCEVFKEHEVLIATHQDRDHIHTHFIVNSVSYEDGHKFQMSAHDLQDMKELSDQICREHGLSICEKGKSFDGEERTGIVAWTKEKYQYLKNVVEEKAAKSYVRDTAEAVKDSMQRAKNKDEFCCMMKEKGYDVDWKENHKHITFINSEGKKVRDTNLSKTFNIEIGKEELIEIFKANSVVSEQEQLSFLKRRAIVSEYRLHEYIEAKSEIESKLEARRTRVEVATEKHNTAVRTIAALKEDINIWTQERDACNSLQFMKKYDLQEQINHGKALIDSIRADRDDFLNRYGFRSVEQMKEFADDFREAEQTALQLEKRVDSERDVVGSLEIAIQDMREEHEAQIEISEEDLAEVKEILKEEFGDNFREEALELAEKTFRGKVSTFSDSGNQNQEMGLQKERETQEECFARDDEITQDEPAYSRGR